MPTVSVNNSGQTGGVTSTVAATSTQALGWYFYGNLYNENGTNTAFDKTTSIVYYMGLGNDVMSVDGNALQQAGNTLYIDGGGGSDSLSANLGVVTGAFTMTNSALVTGSASFQNFEVYSVTLGSAGDTVTLTGAAGDSVVLAAGNDTVNVSDSRGTSYFDGGTGFDWLTVNNATQTVGITSAISASGGYFYGNLYNRDGGNVAFDKFEKISYSMGSGSDNLNFDGTSLSNAANSVSVNGGGGAGIDTLSANLGVMTANLTMTDNSLTGGNVGLTGFEFYSVTFGKGNDTVTRTGGKGDSLDLAAGNDTVTVTGSRGSAYYQMGAGFNTLNVDNSAQSAGITSAISSANGYFYGNLYNMDGGNIAYDKTQVLSYKMGSGNDTLSFDGASLATAGNSVSVDAGGGTDRLNVSLAAMTADLTLTDASLSGGNVSLVNFESYGVTFGSGNDTITRTGAAGDSFALGAGNDKATVTNSRGTSSFAFNDGFNTLKLDNSMQTKGITSAISSASGYFYGNLYNDDGGNLAYDRVQDLNYLMGSGDDSIVLGGASLAPAANKLSVDAGAGKDTLSADLTVMTAALAITDGSVIGGNVSLTGFEVFHLATGSGNDSAVLNGMAGNDFTLGAGDDSFKLTNNNGSTGLTMGAGFDTLILDNASQSTGITSSINSTNGYFYGNLYNASGGNLSYDGVEAMTYTMGSGNDALIFGAASLVGTADAISVNAAGGSDGLAANLSMLGTNIMVTDTSVTTTRLSLTNFETYNLDLGGGNDTVVLTNGDNDSIRLNGGVDSLTVTNVRTSNTFDGGGNIDALTVNNGAQTVGVTSAISSSSGYFYGNLYNASGGNTAYDHFEQLIYTMGSGDDSVTFDGASLGASPYNMVKLFAGAGNDTLTANLGTVNFGVIINSAIVAGGNIYMTGFDNFNVTTGDLADNVYIVDGAAGDSYVLKGGNDFVTLVNTLGSTYVDGGADNDVLRVINGTETNGVTSAISASNGYFYGNLYNDTGGNTAFDHVENLFYATGFGNDTLNVDASSLAAPGTSLYFDGGGGVDTININLSALGPLVVYYNAGSWNFAGCQIVQFENVNFTFGSAGGNFVLDAANNSFAAGNGNDSINGGDGNDLLRGNGGNDTLSGGAGADNMYGGNGDDLYYVDNTGDHCQEQTTFGTDDGGTDTVVSSVSFTLEVFVENMLLSGSAAINGTGNTSNNIITGNGADNVLSGLAGDDKLTGAAGNDTLVGGAGNDTLSGGAGNDNFLFDHFGAANGTDHIADFATGLDKLAFKASDFGWTTGHVLTAAEYHTGPAAGTGGQFLYDTASHTLSWDADGTGAGAATAIVVFDTNVTPAASDFLFL